MVCLKYVSHVETIHPNKPFSTFPKQIGEWTGREQRFEKKYMMYWGLMIPSCAIIPLLMAANFSSTSGSIKVKAKVI